MLVKVRYDRQGQPEIKNEISVNSQRSEEEKGRMPLIIYAGKRGNETSITH